MLSKVKHCASQANLDYDVLKKCYHSPESQSLQKKAAAMTPADHQYVPWVLVNGKLSPSDGDNILQEVCEAYNGNKPKACQQLAMERNSKRCVVGAGGRSREAGKFKPSEL